MPQTLLNLNLTPSVGAMSPPPFLLLLLLLLVLGVVIVVTTPSNVALCVNNKDVRGGQGLISLSWKSFTQHEGIYVGRTFMCLRNDWTTMTTTMTMTMKKKL